MYRFLHRITLKGGSIVKSRISLIFSFIFISFIAIWAFMVFSVRVIDVTFDDKLSLLSKMPNYFLPSLFLLASLSLLSFYLRKSLWSMAFAGLFALYFCQTPWLIEPLRGIDTYYHFSRVQVVIENGYVPGLADASSVPGGRYFQYPGSTIWSAMLLSVTGMASIEFVKYFFPILSTFVLYLGFLILVRKVCKSSLPLGPSLLFLSLFGYGGYLFSPFGFGWMLIPFLLFLLLKLERISSFMCFALLCFGLAISHPTTSAFFVVAFIILAFAIRVFRKRIAVHAELIWSRVLTFITIVLLWSSFEASRVFLPETASFIRTLFDRLFNPYEVIHRIQQPIYLLFEISVLRRIFVISTGIFAAIVILVGTFEIIRKRKADHEVIFAHKERLLVPISIAFAGLLLFPLFLISVPVFGLYYFFTFGLFGAAIGFGLLKVRSRKSFCLLGLFVLLLITPAFVEAHPVEQYDIMRDSIHYGVKFTGQYINCTEKTLVSPLCTQLYSFMDLVEWRNIQMPLYSESENVFVSQVKKSNYFIFRMDGVYVSSLLFERVNPKDTKYLQISMRLLNDTFFDVLYSSESYIIFANMKDV